MNKFIVIGNLTRDAELVTTGDKSRCRFSVAVNRRKTNEGSQTADFFDFVSFGKMAELVATYCKKGDKVCVSAHVENNNYTTAEGEQRYGFNFIASEVEFLTPKNSAESVAEE